MRRWKARRTVGTSGASASVLSRERTERRREGERVGELKAGVVALGDRDCDEGGKEKDGEIDTMTEDEGRNGERGKEREREGSRTRGGKGKRGRKRDGEKEGRRHVAVAREGTRANRVETRDEAIRDMAGLPCVRVCTRMWVRVRRG